MTPASAPNLGFAGGYNRAVAETDGDYVVLLNNDTRVASTWLERARRRGGTSRRGGGSLGDSRLGWIADRLRRRRCRPFVGHSWQMDYGRAGGQGLRASGRCCSAAARRC